MLKNLKKRITLRKLNNAKLLAAALSTAAVLALPGAAAAADGLYFDTSGGVIVNHNATVTGDNGIVNIAPSLFITIYTGATITGTASGGAGIDNSGTITTLDNNGSTITGTDSVGHGGYGISNAGTVTTLNNNNNGTITGTEFGIYNVAGTITTLNNNGTISGTYSGIYNTRTITTLGNSGTISCTAASNPGIYNSGTITTLNNSGTISGTGSGGGGYGIYNTGTIGTITNTGTISGSRCWIYVDSSASANVVSESGGKLYGATFVSSTGGILNLTLNDSTWTVTGDSSLTNLTLGSGVVKFAESGAYHNITARTLSGSGNFYLNSNLAAGTSDAITVTGTASGSYKLYITNTGNLPSTGQYVKVVDLMRGSTATFSGGGDAGAYYLGVTQGSALSGAPDSEDYYLYYAGPSSASRAAIDLTADNVVAWYGEMNEIKKRMGDLRMGTQSSDDFWVRTYADKYNIRPAGSDAYSQFMHGIELGKDNPQSFTGGKKYTGFVLGTGKATDTFTSGNATTHSTYAGAYASWLRDDGSYFDLIGKYNWFSHRFDTALLSGSDSGSYDNNGLGLSAEIGKRFEQKNGDFIEPAAELSALWASKASYTTANGLAVETPATNSLQFRLGVTAGRKWKDKDGATRQFYGKVSWVNEYKGDSTTRVDTAAFDSSLKGHQWVTGLGFIEDARHYQLYLDAEKSWGNTTSKEWGMNAGYRWKF